MRKLFPALLLTAALALSSCGQRVAEVADLDKIFISFGERCSQLTAAEAKNYDVVYEQGLIPAFADEGCNYSRSVCHFAYLLKSEQCSTDELTTLMGLTMKGLLPIDGYESLTPDRSSLKGQIKKGWVNPQDYLDYYLKPKLINRKTPPAEITTALQSEVESLVRRSFISQQQADALKF